MESHCWIFPPTISDKMEQHHCHRLLRNGLVSKICVWRGNGILQGGVEALMNALVVSNCALESLDLSQTSCGAQGAAAAVKCTKLTSLRLFNNKLGSDGFETLVPLLKGGHASLVNLDLGGNDASEEAVVKLLNSIADDSAGFRIKAASA